MPGPSTAELNGLNPHVQVEPLTLAIVSLEEELLFELPHPATITIDSAATKISDPKRFIDPPFPNRPSPAESPTDHPITQFGKYLNKRNISLAVSVINASIRRAARRHELARPGRDATGEQAGPGGVQSHSDRSLQRGPFAQQARL